MSARQLRDETSSRARDLHHLGRFSKRIGLVWARDEEARQLVLDAQRAALEVLADHALAILPSRFSLDTFLLSLLRLSYIGEPRVIEPGKVERLFRADRDAYRAIGRMLLERRATEQDGEWLQPLPSEYARAATEELISRSRLRAFLRWPKNLLTFDNWLDYVLHKIERNTGKALVLTDRQKRHPLLFGWPQLFALRRQGLLR